MTLAGCSDKAAGNKTEASTPAAKIRDLTPEEKFSETKRESDAGHADAQYNLGAMYAIGNGVPQDSVKAEEWWQKAAAQGHADAQFNLGAMYANGDGVPQDSVKAVGWWQKAAAQGHADAQFNLGRSYYKQIALAQTSGDAGLTREVREAKRVAQALRASADKIDADVWIGTMHNETGIQQHTCYALGMLLGFDENVRHLRFDRNQSLAAQDSEQAYDLRINAQSLDNFEIAVARSLNMSLGQRGIVWDLDCAGKHGISAETFNQMGVSTFYEVINTDGGQGIRILGAIEKGFAARLSATLGQNPNVAFVELGSGGGSVAEALAAGRLIRAKGLATSIWTNCYSACPLVFLGGVDRHIHSPYPSLGFHQISSSAGAVAPRAPVYVQVASYIREMGVDDRFVVTAMMEATPAQMNMINGADVRLCEARIATWVQRACEVKP
jgi:TPR repeat protein